MNRLSRILRFYIFSLFYILLLQNLSAGEAAADSENTRLPQLCILIKKEFDKFPEKLCSYNDEKTKVEVKKQEYLSWLIINYKVLSHLSETMPNERLMEWLHYYLENEYLKFLIKYKVASADNSMVLTVKTRDRILEESKEKYNKWEFKSKNMTYQQWVKSLGLNVNEIIEIKYKELVIKAWEKKIRAGVIVTDKDIEEYYKNHKQIFWNDEMYSLHQIFIECNKDNRQEKKKEAEMIFERLQNGEEFKNLLRYSDAKSKNDGGFVGYFSKGEILGEMEKVCMELAKNRLNELELVESRKGYHIIKVQEYFPEGYRELDENLKMKIRNTLKVIFFREKVDNNIMSILENSRKSLIYNF